MLYNPLTQQLYTDDKTPLKKLHCPYNVAWNALEGDGVKNKQCTHCSKTIINATEIEEVDLVKILQENPSSCIKIESNDSKIKLIL